MTHPRPANGRRWIEPKQTLIIDSDPVDPNGSQILKGTQQMSDDYLYKFIGVNNDWWKGSLERRELLFRHFKDPLLNDIYEGHFGVRTEWPSVYKEPEIVARIIHDLNPKDAHINTASVLAMKEFIRINPDIANQVLNIIISRDKRYRICSFTRRWNHILMWGHYTYNFSGLALAFSYSGLNASQLSHYQGDVTSVHGEIVPPMMVRYQRLPPLIDAFEFSEFLTHQTDQLKRRMAVEIVNKCFLTKYDAWRYEQETRVIAAIDGETTSALPLIVKYPQNALRAILVGPKCDPNSIIEAADLVDDNIEFRLIVQMPNRYKMKVNAVHKASEIKSRNVKFKR